MLIPSKDLNISESILGLSSLLIKCLMKRQYNLDELWKDYCNKYQKKGIVYHSFDNFMIAIDFLYLIGKINVDSEGGIYIV